MGSTVGSLYSAFAKVMIEEINKTLSDAIMLQKAKDLAVMDLNLSLRYL